MTHRIELPPELQSLIEKREQADRRQGLTQPGESSVEQASTDDFEQVDRRQGPRRTDDQGAE